MSAVPRKITFGTAPKFHNKPTVRLIAGKSESFPSLLEANVYAKLVLMERAGKIRNLTRDKKDCTFEMRVGGQLVCRYIADFIFDEMRDGAWHEVVADAKGCRTPIYKLKKKLMAACLGIEIREL